MELYQTNPLHFSKVYQKVIFKKTEEDIENMKEYVFVGIDYKKYEEFFRVYKNMEVDT